MVTSTNEFRLEEGEATAEDLNLEGGTTPEFLSSNNHVQIPLIPDQMEDQHISNVTVPLPSENEQDEMNENDMTQANDCNIPNNDVAPDSGLGNTDSVLLLWGYLTPLLPNHNRFV